MHKIRQNQKFLQFFLKLKTLNFHIKEGKNVFRNNGDDSEMGGGPSGKTGR